MNNLKVGDTVKLIDNDSYYFNKSAKVVEILPDFIYPYELKFEDGEVDFAKREEIELINNNLKVGDKVKILKGLLKDKVGVIATVTQTNYISCEVKLSQYITELFVADDLQKVNEVFTKADLKDGMICTLRNNIKTILFELDFTYKTCQEFVWLASVSNFTNDLMFDGNNRDLDIMQVTYNGEVVFSREEKQQYKIFVNGCEDLHVIFDSKEPLLKELSNILDDTTYTEITIKKEG